MATEYNSIIRLKKIDECLRNKNKVYNLQDLKTAIRESLERYDKKIALSDRTLYDDLKFLKNEFGPFEAPIVRSNDKGYYYKDAGYSIFNPNVDEDNSKVLQSSITALRQVSNMKGFEELKNILFRIEASYNFDEDELNDPIVYIEEGLNISAQNLIESLKKYIQNKESISIVYKPFDKESYSRTISPYFLKEYNNRWFLFGYQHGKNESDYSGMTNVPLDRITSIKTSFKEYETNKEYDFKSYFDNVIGVTVSGDDKVNIVFKVYGSRRHYITTKKVHKSQTTLEMNDQYGLFSISVIPNRELYSHFLGFSGDLEVVKPKIIRENMKDHVEHMMSRYQ